MPHEFVSRNTEQRERLRTVVGRLQPGDMAREIGGGWTIGDTLVHLAFYDRRAAILLTRYARDGVTASPYDYDTINEALLFLSRALPPEAIAAEVIAAAEAADAAAATTPDALLPDIERRQEVKLSRADHRRGHLDDIESLLAE